MKSFTLLQESWKTESSQDSFFPVPFSLYEIAQSFERQLALSSTILISNHQIFSHTHNIHPSLLQKRQFKSHGLQVTSHFSIKNRWDSSSQSGLLEIITWVIVLHLTPQTKYIGVGARTESIFLKSSIQRSKEHIRNSSHNFQPNWNPAWQTL